MKKINSIGRILILIGVLHLFRRVRGPYGFGGLDNTTEILLISLILIVVGIILEMLDRSEMEKSKK